MNAVINYQHKQSQISDDRLQVHKFVNPVEKIFKKLPKRLEWKRFQGKYQK